MSELGTLVEGAEVGVDAWIAKRSSPSPASFLDNFPIEVFGKTTNGRLPQKYNYKGSRVFPSVMLSTDRSVHRYSVSMAVCFPRASFARICMHIPALATAHDMIDNMQARKQTKAGQSASNKQKSSSMKTSSPPRASLLFLRETSNAAKLNKLAELLITPLCRSVLPFNPSDPATQDGQCSR